MANNLLYIYTKTSGKIFEEGVMHMSRGYNEEIDVDMTPGGRIAVCHSSQYDVNRKIRVNLYKEKSTAFLGENALVKLSVRKTDGTIISTDDSNVISIQTEEPSVGGRWYYILICTTQQMTACVGNNLCEIVVTETDNGVTSIIGSANFTLQVEKDPLAGGIESGSVISDLQEQVDTCVEHSLNDMSINDLSDVDAESATNGQALVYDATNHKWIPGAGGGGGASALADLTDVSLQTTALRRSRHQQLTLVRNGSNWYWTNKGVNIELSGTLYAGVSTLTLQTDDSEFDFDDDYGAEPEIFTSVKGVVPYDVSVSGNAVTMKFIPQSAPLTVYARFTLDGPIN